MSPAGTAAGAAAGAARAAAPASDPAEAPGAVPEDPDPAAAAVPARRRGSPTSSATSADPASAPSPAVAAILDVLAGDEMNGYQLIQQISERTGGAWKPSPGSVYPTVQQLEDEGLVEGRDVEGRRLLRLTDAGRAYVEENAEEMAATWRPFEESTEEEAPRPSGGANDLMPLVGQVMGGMWQVVTTGTSQQRAEAAEILTETRRKLYRLLADGDPE